jgi:predicted dehydrogenase
VNVAIDAMRAGKDIYCEKPATLTIVEGGVLERVTVAVGSGPNGTEYPTSMLAGQRSWDMWRGQTPSVNYIQQRCHGSFRWWYEYSGGKMTDWGAHHVDIAQWAIAADLPGPESIEVIHAEHPVTFENGMPTVRNTYNTAMSFNVRCVFPGGVEMFIVNDATDFGFENGILFEGENGRYFVNRGKLTGSPVEDLARNPLPEELFRKLRKGCDKVSHRENFFICCDSRGTPIADAESHCRHLTTCHLANIAMRLGRTLKWDAVTQQVVGDEQANAFQKRVQRKGFEVV